MNTIIGDSDITILIKFVDPQFVETTMDGNIYFTRNEYFMNLEEREGNKGISDKYEGQWREPIINDKFYIEINEDEWVPLNYETCISSMYLESLKGIPICCFVRLSLNNDFEVVPNTNYFRLKSLVEMELKEQFNGRNMLVIYNGKEFIDRITLKANQLNYKIIRKDVKYYDMENRRHPLPADEYVRTPIKGLFFKSNIYKHQKEFRIAITKPFEENVTLDIGDIRDIASNLGLVEVAKELPLIIGSIKI